MGGAFACLRRSLLVALVAVACDDAEPEVAPMEPLPLAFSGCEQLDHEGRCGIRPGETLTIWVEGERAPAVRILGAEADTDPPERVLGGWRWNLTVATDWNTVHLLRDRTESLLMLTTPDVPEPIREARAARAAGELDRARSILDSFTPSDDRGRGLREGMLARVAFSRGDNDGCLSHYDAARPFLERARAHDQIVSDGLAAVFVLHRRLGRVGDARALLEELEPHATDSVGRIRWDVTQGTLQHAVGDLRSALTSLTRASRDAQRLGMRTERFGADEMRADSLVRLGRFAEADRIMDELGETVSDAPPCTRADYLANVGHQRTKTEDPERLRSALEPLRAARALYAGECPRSASLANAHLNLAHAGLRLGNLEDASQELEKAASIDASDATIEAWVLELRLALAVRAGAYEDALARAETLESRARAAGWLRSVWWALLGRGRALRGLGRDRDAALALDHAEAVLDRLYQRLPLDGAQGLALVEHDASAAERVTLALERGHPDRALAIARHARRRRLGAAHRAVRIGSTRQSAALDRYWAHRRALRERTEETWSLALDRLAEHAAESEALESRALEDLDRAFPPLDRELPPLPDDELALVLFPTEGGVAVLASLAGEHRGSVRAQDDLLEGLDDWIASATAVRVLAHGTAAAIDVHQLPWNGDALGARKVVLHALDRPRSRGADGGAVLVVSDPSGDLAGARTEAGVIAAHWAERGAAVRQLGGDEATHAAFVRELRGAARLHYAGHGEARESGLWGSGLRLAGNERLTTADILALPTVPPDVILSGCETGEPDGGVLGLGLAHAFVAAGASRVVGSTTAVDDATAERVGRVLGQAPADQWPEKLRELTSELGERMAAFRLYVP